MRVLMSLLGCMALVSCKSSTDASGCDQVCQVVNPRNTLWVSRPGGILVLDVALFAGGSGRAGGGYCTGDESIPAYHSISWQQLGPASILITDPACLNASIVNIAGGVSQGFFLAGLHGATVRFDLTPGSI